MALWYFLISLSLFFKGSPDSIINHPWELRKANKRIKVFTRYQNDSNFKELKITFKVKSSIENLTWFLNDVSNYHKWVYKCPKAWIVKRISDEEFIYHTTSDLPFPSSDRDVIIHSKKTKLREGVYQIIGTARPNYSKELDGYVRVQYFNSNWIIKELGKGILDIEYTVSTHPGGYIPAWVSNLAIAVGPIHTINKLIDQVQAMEN